jgi:ferredoxin
MMKTFAVRNLKLCTKDCLCLYVCPSGATDTENSIIDISKCTGCGVCADACPSGAISMVPWFYPPQQPKKESVCDALNAMAQSKMDAEKSALQISASTNKDGLARLMKAVAKSERLIAEDIMREAGYMLPQSHNTHMLLENLIKNPPEGFPVEAAEKLLAMLPDNEL